ncbi:MAG: Gfo/Idh/MocA family oxidoreductase [Albidovulum sp.]|nr:Gfo/Idh/MocA family oxidoreductase [Albidovulum sp.]MDE0303967.1 Gfo/Idh/MocA family oxidoreductase [Albidovulum sp.]MDE0532475.1 Gfo/Idh/MocA family oxidoreductase [Albidovulum sp.]
MLKIGIVGFGWWGRHIATRLSRHGGFKLLAIADKNESVHEGISELGATPVSDLDDILSLPAIDAVVLASPNDLHDSQVAACAAAGVNVFCEKPLSLTAAGARSSVDACNNAGVLLGVGHERRFETAIQILKRALDANELGTIMHAELAFSHDKLKHHVPGSWRTVKRFAPAAGMAQMGIHLTDLLIWFFGPVASIHAIAADRELGWETGDIVTVQMQFKAGMIAQMQAILNTPHFLRTHVFGSREWIEIRNATHPDTPGGEVRMTRYRNNEDQDTSTFDWNDTVTANLRNFAAAIRGEEPYLISDEEKVHNIEVLEAIVRSAETGEAVRL